MPNTIKLFVGGLRNTNSQLFVYLPRISRNYFSMKMFRKANGNVRLSNGRRSCYNNQGV